MTGYDGYSKSNNARHAEANERYPISRAAPALADKLGWNIPKAKAFLKSLPESEYHHVSKMYNIVFYYDTSDEWIMENKELIDAFQYDPKKRDKKKRMFKCYNFLTETDPRKWRWTISVREGNNMHDLEKASLRVMEIRSKSVEAITKGVHQATIRKAMSIIQECDKILKAIGS